MKSNQRLRKILLGISTGLFTGSLLIFFFSALFSYTKETNLIAGIMFVVSLLVFYVIEITKSPSTPRTAKLIGGKISSIIFVIAVPIIFSIILIKGDIRSWFLVIIAALLCWMIIK